MKHSTRGWTLLLTLLPWGLHAQYNQKQDVFDKANNAVNKAVTAIAVFQPYLLKARQLFYDAKQMGADFKRDAKQTFGKDSGNSYNSNNSYNNNTSSNNNSYGNNSSSNSNNS